VRWAGAVLSCLIGLVILDALSRFILGRTRQLRDSTPPARPALSREFEKT
jgi:hypothetical protein